VAAGGGYTQGQWLSTPSPRKTDETQIAGKLDITRRRIPANDAPVTFLSSNGM